MIDKQDACEGAQDTYSKVEKSKTSSVGGNALEVASWTEGKCQTSWDPLRLRTSPKQETDINSRLDALATNELRDSLLASNAIQENGFGSPPDKQRHTMNNRDNRDFQCDHIVRERQKTSETPLKMDFLPKDNEARTESDMKHCEAWKIKDPSPMKANDCNQTGDSHSELTKMVPLKPQRSKKSLNKENKGVLDLRTHSQSDKGIFGLTEDVHMAKSKDGFCETGRRVDDYALLKSATDVVKENTMAAKYHSEAAMSYQQQAQLQQIKNELFQQQEPRDCRSTTGQSQSTRGGVLHEDHLRENPLSSSKFPTAPPRSLPLKTQWSRDRQSNMDNSHVHYRKQAVNHRPPTCLVSHRKVKHCMSFNRCRASLFFFPI